ncbi:MAG: alpha-glucuronidase family glycosyl hydrolase, partial [Acidobacteriaceae bacterium]
MFLNVRTRRLLFLAALLCAAAFSIAPAHAEDGSRGWLRYAPPFLSQPDSPYAQMPPAVVTLDSSPIAATAQSQLQEGVRSMLHRTLRIEPQPPDYSAWILGTAAELRSALPQYHPPQLRPEGFSVSTLTVHGHTDWLIAGADSRGILYGTFYVLSSIAQGQSFTALKGSQSPAAPIRWVNQWDNLNGTI